MVTSPASAMQFRGAATTHEFMHAWNVERIRPKSLEPFNFEEPSVSEELWFAEGFTSYYDPLVSRRAGLISIDRFCASLGGLLTNLLSSPGRQIYSAPQMSERASFSDGALRPMGPAAAGFDNFRNTYFSHYPFGMALALGIDLSIRSEFPGKSLDDWMRAMWIAYGRTQRNYAPAKPYILSDLQTTLASVTSTGFAARIFDDHIRGTKALPYEALLSRAGLLLRLSAPHKVWFDNAGLQFDKDGMRLTMFPLVGGLFDKAGLDRGDRIVDLGGLHEYNADAFNAWLAKQKPGERVKAKVIGPEGERDVELVLPADPRLELVTFERAGRTTTPQQDAFRQAWLASKVAAPGKDGTLHVYCPKCRRALPFEYEKCPFDAGDLGIVPPPPQ
jgi:predicted metalloprotease with PDZ domain